MIKQSGSGTVVGSNVKLQGVLKDTENIIIHGQLDGELSSEQSVLVAEQAVVKGPISGDTVTVAGVVKGSIDAKKKLEILPSGRVNGSVTTKEFVVQSGAIFNGKIVMPEEKAEDKHETGADEAFPTKNLYGPSIKENKDIIEKGAQKIDSELEYELE